MFAVRAACVQRSPLASSFGELPLLHTCFRAWSPVFSVVTVVHVMRSRHTVLLIFEVAVIGERAAGSRGHAFQCSTGVNHHRGTHLNLLEVRRHLLNRRDTKRYFRHLTENVGVVVRGFPPLCRSSRQSDS